MSGEILAFDSDWFGMKVGRMDGDPVLADMWAQENELDLLYTLLPIESTHLLQSDLGFQVVDVRVEFTAPTRSGPWEVRYAIPDDMGMLEEIARTSFTRTRFYNDRRLPRDRVDALYVNWLRESTQVLVAVDEEDQPDGFVTIRDGDIDLIAVREGARKRGQGTSLVVAALDHALDSGLATMNVVTQGGNIAAQKLFQKCGFRSRSSAIWIHRHYQ